MRAKARPFPPREALKELHPGGSDDDHRGVRVAFRQPINDRCEQLRKLVVGLALFERRSRSRMMSASAGGDWAGMLRSYLMRRVKPITTSTISSHVVGLNRQNAPTAHPFQYNAHDHDP
jgi:hypothetical protein